ncbi:MAG: cupredoxin family copper-binding protein [Candidatus Acidiferrales bacterium]
MSGGVRRFAAGAFALTLGLVAAILFGAMNSGAVPGQQDTQKPVVEVHVDNFTFGPKAVTVAPGTKVVWTNRDDIPHTVVSTDKLFKSKALDTGDSFSFEFTKPGKYAYFCSIHPEMTGEVEVN